MVHTRRSKRQEANGKAVVDKESTREPVPALIRLRVVAPNVRSLDSSTESADGELLLSSGDQEFLSPVSHPAASQNQESCSVPCGYVQNGNQGNSAAVPDQRDTEFAHDLKNVLKPQRENTSCQRNIDFGVNSGCDVEYSTCSVSQSTDITPRYIVDGTKNGDNQSNPISQDIFGWLMQSEKVITIDPLDTIPLTCIRAVSDSGVAKLEFAFQKSGKGPGMSTGVSNAAPQPIVVTIPEERLHIVVEYYMSIKGLSAKNAHAISLSKVWYGMVEGAHRRKALINLYEKDPSHLKGYPWVVLCV